MKCTIILASQPITSAKNSLISIAIPFLHGFVKVAEMKKSAHLEFQPGLKLCWCYFFGHVGVRGNGSDNKLISGLLTDFSNGGGWVR